MALPKSSYTSDTKSKEEVLTTFLPLGGACFGCHNLSQLGDREISFVEESYMTSTTHDNPFQMSKAHG